MKKHLENMEKDRQKTNNPLNKCLITILTSAAKENSTSQRGKEGRTTSG